MRSPGLEPLPLAAAAQNVSQKQRAGVMIWDVRNEEALMPRILKDATIAKTKRRRLTANTKLETHRLTAEIFVSGGRRIITIRIDEEVAGHISELQGKWHYRPGGVPSAKSQPAIGSTEEEVLDWWMRSQGFQYVEDK
jgi:hypothetical protein